MGLHLKKHPTQEQAEHLHEEDIQFCIQKDTVHNIYRCLQKGNKRFNTIEQDIHKIKEALYIKDERNGQTKERINQIGELAEKVDKRLEKRVERVENWILRLLFLMLGSLLTSIVALLVVLLTR